MEVRPVHSLVTVLTLMASLAI
ncbi:phage holin family protein, partial [Xanthomonas oryzae pv. oryzae]